MKLYLMTLSIFLTACNNQMKSVENIQRQFPNSTIITINLENRKNDFDFLVIDSTSVNIVGCHNFINDDITSILTIKK